MVQLKIYKINSVQSTKGAQFQSSCAENSIRYASRCVQNGLFVGSVVFSLQKNRLIEPLALKNAVYTPSKNI